MAETQVISARIVLRNDTIGNWTAASSQVLLSGEVAVEFQSDGSVKLKIGDGTTSYKNLAYFTGTLADDITIEDDNGTYSIKGFASAYDTSVPVKKVTSSGEKTLVWTPLSQLLSDTDGNAVDLTDYATKEYVDTQIANIDVSSGGTADGDTISVGDSTSITTVASATGYVISIKGVSSATSSQALFANGSSGVTWKKTYTAAEVDSLLDSTLATAQTAADTSANSALDAAKAYTDSQVLSASTGGTVDLSNYASTSYVDTQISEAKAYTDSQIAAIDLSGVSSGSGSVDLTGYATETYVDNATATALSDAKAYADSQIASVASGGSVDLSGYATDTELATAVASGLTSAKEYTDDQVSTINITITGIEERVAALETKVTANENNISSLQSNVATAQSDITALQTDLDAAEAKIETIQGDETTTGSIAYNLAAAKTYTDEKVATVESSVATNTTAVANVSTTVSALQTQLSSDEDAIRTIQSDVSALDTRVTTAESNIDNINSIVKTLESAASGEITGLDDLNVIDEAQTGQYVSAVSQAYGKISVTRATLPTYSEATTTAAGLISSSDKSKLDGIEANANNYELPAATASALGGVKAAAVRTTAPTKATGGTDTSRNYGVELDSGNVAFVNVPWENTTYSEVTTSTSGLMTASDKSKLDGIATGANAYELPTATASTKGGITVAAVRTTSPNKTTGGTDASKNYGVELDSAGVAFVNVPWTNTDTTYTAGSGLTLSDASFAVNTSYTTSGKNYKVAVDDTTGGLYVNVPWTDTETVISGTTTGSGNVVTAVSVADGVVTVTKGSTALLSSQKGVAGGLAELDSDGLVPSSQLPSYVDDVLEYDDYDNLPTTGETGKIYVTTDDNLTYRWSGSAYVEISSSLALGETSSTAYRGDRGATAYAHAISSHAPTDAEANQNAFSNVVVGTTTVAASSTTDTLTFTAGANITLTPTASNKSVTIAASDTHYSADMYVGATGVASNSSTSNGSTYLKLWENGSSKANFKISGAGATTVASDASGNITITSTDTNTEYTAGTGLSLSEGTINHAASISASSIGPAADTTLASGSAFIVPYITYNGTGHITAVASRTMTMPTITTYTGTSPITISSGAIGHATTLSTTTTDTFTYGSSTAESIANGGSFTVPYVTFNAYGHATAGGTRTITLPTITNSVNASDTSLKIFLLGATSQAASQTAYSHDTAYVGTDGHLYSNSKQVVNLSDSQALSGKTYNGYTLAAACAKDISDSTTAGAFSSTGTSLVTERDAYYATPSINGSKAYSSSTTIYAPIGAGTSGNVLVSTGSGAPEWKSSISLDVDDGDVA